MTEKKSRFSIKHLVYIVPALFALLFGAIIMLPISFAVMFILQAKLGPQSILVCVGVVAVGLDYLTLSKIKHAAMPEGTARVWRVSILLIPLLGALSFLILKPHKRHFKLVEGDVQP